MGMHRIDGYTAASRHTECILEKASVVFQSRLAGKVLIAEGYNIPNEMFPMAEWFGGEACPVYSLGSRPSFVRSPA